ncbi:hypothetical protein VTO73DRAFT_7213 [Trametes versicolor]
MMRKRILGHSVVSEPHTRASTPQTRALGSRVPKAEPLLEPTLRRVFEKHEPEEAAVTTRGATEHKSTQTSAAMSTRLQGAGQERPKTISLRAFGKAPAMASATALRTAPAMASANAFEAAPAMAPANALGNAPAMASATALRTAPAAPAMASANALETAPTMAPANAPADVAKPLVATTIHVGNDTVIYTWVIPFPQEPAHVSEESYRWQMNFPPRGRSKVTPKIPADAAARVVTKVATGGNTVKYHWNLCYPEHRSPSSVFRTEAPKRVPVRVPGDPKGKMPAELPAKVSRDTQEKPSTSATTSATTTEDIEATNRGSTSMSTMDYTLERLGSSSTTSARRPARQVRFGRFD